MDRSQPAWSDVLAWLRLEEVGTTNALEDAARVRAAMARVHKDHLFFGNTSLSRIGVISNQRFATTVVVVGGRRQSR